MNGSNFATTYEQELSVSFVEFGAKAPAYGRLPQIAVIAESRQMNDDAVFAMAPYGPDREFTVLFLMR